MATQREHARDHDQQRTSAAQRVGVSGKDHPIEQSGKCDRTVNERTHLGRWRKLEPGRAAKMREALQRILAAPGLSKDVFEQASKSLGS